jgi:hypothetical protein
MSFFEAYGSYSAGFYSKHGKDLSALLSMMMSQVGKCKIADSAVDITGKKG